jgi:hypothetical protein
MSNWRYTQNSPRAIDRMLFRTPGDRPPNAGGEREHPALLDIRQQAQAAAFEGLWARPECPPSRFVAGSFRCGCEPRSDPLAPILAEGGSDYSSLLKSAFFCTIVTGCGLIAQRVCVWRNRAHWPAGF